MRRILVAGVTGAGKSTLATALSQRLGVPYHEMDALHFTGPDWEVNPDFVPQVARIAATPAWIFDSYGYPDVRDLLWERADTVVWLDYPRHVTMPRILRRSLRRTLLRERVFGGNRETVREWFSSEHPVWHSWMQHTSRGDAIRDSALDPRFAPIAVHRFSHPSAVAAWVRTL